MKNPLPPPSVPPPPGTPQENGGSLDPSELAEVILGAEARPAERTAETSTLAIPAGHLDQVQSEAQAPSRAAGSRTEVLPVLASAPPSGGVLKRWLGLAACLLLAGVAVWWFLRPKPQEDAGTGVPVRAQAPPAAEPVPPELRPYLDRAARGDAQAMHMIALMYWNGLNVKQDRVKGLAWYRKSAEAGDKAARKELGVIEGR